MILSMTGFGRGTAVLNGREITVELRSVNSRYFEYSSRIPRKKHDFHFLLLCIRPQSKQHGCGSYRFLEKNSKMMLYVS